MSDFALIGGTGLTKLDAIEISHQEAVHTPFGDPSGPITRGKLHGREILFLPRHGYDHTIPPHKVNYCANIWALKDAGAQKVLAIAAVGGITSAMQPTKLVVPDQIVDYTHSRMATFFEENLQSVTHIDFTEPYSEPLRQLILDAAQTAKIDIIGKATYGATQGPRLETIAEINRMERDSCDIVGMTGMPEAALARELELNYATCAVVANPAAGRGDGQITMEEIEKQLEHGMADVVKLLNALVDSL